MLKERFRRIIEERALYGSPAGMPASPAYLAYDVCRRGRLGLYIWRSRRIHGWTRGDEAVELALASSRLPDSPTIVEVGSFVGCSAVLLAGARKLKRSGRVHCVDPFIPFGDAFSLPIYRRVEASLSASMRESFDSNIRLAGLADWIVVHQMTALDAAARWLGPIDMLFLDGDQSPAGAREAFLAWSPHLRPGGLLAIGNSADVLHERGHDGSRRVVAEFVRAPEYREVRRVQTTTFAVKTDAPPMAALSKPDAAGDRARA